MSSHRLCGIDLGWMPGTPQSCSITLPTRSQVLLANLFQLGLLSPWGHRSCLPGACSSHELPVESRPHLGIWCGVLPRLQVHLCSLMDPCGLQGSACSMRQGWNMAGVSGVTHGVGTRLCAAPKAPQDWQHCTSIPSTSCLDARHLFLTCSQIQSNSCGSRSLDLSPRFDSSDPSLRHSTRMFPLAFVASGTALKHIPRDNCRAGLLGHKSLQCWQQE